MPHIKIDYLQDYTYKKFIDEYVKAEMFSLCSFLDDPSHRKLQRLKGFIINF